MPRTTLPDFDPLTHLGIGTQPPGVAVVPRTSLPPERPERVAKRAITPKPDPVQNPAIEPNGSPPLLVPEPSHVASPEPTEASQITFLPPAAPTPAPRLPVRPVPLLRPSKAKMSARVPADLWEEARDCVVWHGHTMTIDAFTEAAFREHLKRLRRQHNLGDRFPGRDREPKQGRRVS